MFLSAPRGFASAEAVAERHALLQRAPAAQPLREWSAGLVERRRVADAAAVAALVAANAQKQAGTPITTLIPHVDPAEAGVAARVLVLLEAPGPMTNDTNPRPGSGFISVDNNDLTAANSWALRNDVGLHDHTLHWNIVPWYLGAASRKPRAAELEQGARELISLLGVLSDVSVIVTSGLYSQRGWNRHVAPAVGDRYTVIPTWHPSPLSLRQPGKRDHLRRAFEQARTLID